MLTKAKSAKNDEFYTQYSDIEKEMQAYLQYAPEVFAGKTLLLPCDDADWSHFNRYFTENFRRLGLKKLISTCIASGGTQGKICVTDAAGSRCSLLQGSGDFRSAEITALRDEADMIITNPPFSLFREFLAWIMAAGKSFSIIGNMNAITYKDVFPLIQHNHIWLGASISSGDREFRVPDSYPLTAAGSRIDAQGNKYVRVKGVRWFTNIEHGRRHQPLPLLTMAENRQRYPQLEAAGAYQQYDNYQAAEVPKTVMIPSDFDGVMGVPISFLDKYNPEQFEIAGMDFYVKDGLLDMLKTAGWQGKLDRAYLNGRRLYSRVLITHRK